MSPDCSWKKQKKQQASESDKQFHWLDAKAVKDKCSEWYSPLSTTILVKLIKIFPTQWEMYILKFFLTPNYHYFAVYFVKRMYLQKHYLTHNYHSLFSTVYFIKGMYLQKHDF